MRKIAIILSIAIVAAIVGWSIYKRGRDRELVAILQTWIGKEITYPSNPNFILGDSIYRASKKGYTILYCIDSTGCTACKLHLEMWVQFMDELNTVSSYPVTLRFITHVSNEHKVRMAFAGHREFSVLNTWKDTTGNLKNLPCQAPINVFLLDSNNNIITIGNPLINAIVKNNYYKPMLISQ